MRHREGGIWPRIRHLSSNIHSYRRQGEWHSPLSLCHHSAAVEPPEKMSSLSSVETKLPPGFRFHPRDEELICDYLMKWITGSSHPLPLLIEVDLNKCEPWDIPDVACVGGKEWYFYSQRDRKYATGMRTNRATVSGYWKATGKDRAIIRKGILVGMRKTLVFYQGRAPKGRKSDWVMHEFRLEGTHGLGPKPDFPVKNDWVLCRVFFKSRSELLPSKTQETTNTNTNPNPKQTIPSSPSLPPLIAMTHAGTTDLYHEQVPCFSIFNNTNPSVSLLNQMDPPAMMEPTKIMPNFGGMVPDIYSSLPLMNSDDDYYNNNSCHDKKMIKAVLNQITKRESGNDQMSMKGGSPSFGEGSSDSYLSEVGLCSMWNHYS